MTGTIQIDSIDGKTAEVWGRIQGNDGKVIEVHSIQDASNLLKTVSSKDSITVKASAQVYYTGVGGRFAVGSMKVLTNPKEISSVAKEVQLLSQKLLTQGKGYLSEQQEKIRQMQAEIRKMEKDRVSGLESLSKKLSPGFTVRISK